MAGIRKSRVAFAASPAHAFTASVPRFSHTHASAPYHVEWMNAAGSPQLQAADAAFERHACRGAIDKIIPSRLTRILKTMIFLGSVVENFRNRFELVRANRVAFLFGSKHRLINRVAALCAVSE